MLLLFFRPHVYGAPPVVEHRFIRFTAEAYAAPSVTDQVFDGDTEDE